MQADASFPEAVKMLDWPLLWREIQNALHTLQPDKHATRRAWRQAKYEVLLSLLGPRSAWARFSICKGSAHRARTYHRLWRTRFVSLET